MKSIYRILIIIATSCIVAYDYGQQCTSNGTGQAPWLIDGDSTASVKYLYTIQSMNFENHTYSHVKKFLLLHPSVVFPDVTYLYWEDDIGIVRKEYHKSDGTIEY